jgi:hypothetical protein
MEVRLPFTPGMFLILIAVRGWVDHRATVRLDELWQLKNPITSSGCEPATLRLTLWCLNQLHIFNIIFSSYILGCFTWCLPFGSSEYNIYLYEFYLGPPLWSSGQSSWLQIQILRVRFPELPDFLRSSGSGTRSTQPHDYNWGATWIESSGVGSRKSRLTGVGIRCADHATHSIRKSWH